MVTVSAALIVRDGAATVERAIASIRPFVDEVVIYLAGESTDGTEKILERLAGEPGPPVRFEQGVWEDDFALARERSFAMASPDADWLLWLDDDEIVEGGALLRPMLAGCDDDVDYVFARSIVPDRLNGLTKLAWRIRIARRDRCTWEGSVHEVLVPDAELAFVVASPAALRVFHDPVDVAGRHDHTAVTLAAIEAPDAPARLLTHAGQELINADRFDEAVETYRRFLELTAGEFMEMRLTAFERLGRCLLSSGDVMAGVTATQQGETERTRWQMLAAAGELRGIAQLGPGWMDALDWRLPKSGRNDPCPCGSGRKAKRCHNGVLSYVTAAAILAPHRKVEVAA